jgi:nicotinamidase-related amidase
MVDELKKYEHLALVYEKNSTSAVFAPGFLDDIKKMKNLKRIVITGCCTDICDLNLALPLRNYFDQVDRDVEIVVPMDAVETYDAPTHKADEWNNMAYKFLEQGGMKLVKTLERNR